MSQKFKLGDICQITGDTMKADHQLPAGTEVTIEGYSRLYLVKATSGAGYRAVYEEDLQLKTKQL